MMRTIKFILEFVAITIFVVAISTGISYIDNHYSIEAVVVDIEEGGCYVLEDRQGNVWACYYDDNDIRISDKVKLNMDAQGTAHTNLDDVVKGIERL